jgi:hypothetical protein
MYEKKFVDNINKKIRIKKYYPDPNANGKNTYQTGSGIVLDKTFGFTYLISHS